MPRIPRAHLNTTFFHIMTQGNNKNYIFNNPIDIKYYISIMYKLIKEYNIKIIAYCIMNNHTHILIETNNLKDLSKYMQRLNMKYGKYYNSKYNKVGYVFRDRYKAQGIYSKEQLENCMKYIYNNPVKAGVCNHAHEYPYSNYKYIPTKTEKEYNFIDINEDVNLICQKVIKEFLITNKTNLNALKEDKNNLKKLIIILKDQYNISLRQIAEEININRERIRRIYNN